jgi:predicted S18 family serine protease
MTNIEPDEDGNYTEQQWDNLPVAKRMRLCASGEYEIQRSDMTDAANYIKKLETSLKNAKSNTQKQGITLTDIIRHKGDRIEKLEAALTHIWAWYPINVSKPHETIDAIKDYAFAVIKGEIKDD